MTKEEIQAQIEVLKTELNKLEELANKPEKFEFKFPVGNTYTVTFNEVALHSSGPISSLLDYGVHRLTEHGAQLSLRRNRRANRLEMLVEHLGGLQECPRNGKELLWTIAYSYSKNKWVIVYDPINYSPEKVYMTEEVANKVVDILNNGEYVL